MTPGIVEQDGEIWYKCSERFEKSTGEHRWTIRAQKRRNVVSDSGGQSIGKVSGASNSGGNRGGQVFVSTVYAGRSKYCAAIGSGKSADVPIKGGVLIELPGLAGVAGAQTQGRRHTRGHIGRLLERPRQGVKRFLPTAEIQTLARNEGVYDSLNSFAADVDLRPWKQQRPESTHWAVADNPARQGLKSPIRRPQVQTVYGSEDVFTSQASESARLQVIDRRDVGLRTSGRDRHKTSRQLNFALPAALLQSRAQPSISRAPVRSVDQSRALALQPAMKTAADMGHRNWTCSGLCGWAVHPNSSYGGFCCAVCHYRHSIGSKDYDWHGKECMFKSGAAFPVFRPTILPDMLYHLHPDAGIHNQDLD